MAVGLLSISALVGALWTTHLLAFDGRVLSGAAIWKYAALWAALDLLVAFFEEGQMCIRDRSSRDFDLFVEHEDRRACPPRHWKRYDLYPTGDCPIE